MSDEKVWRGCIETDDGEWPKDDERPRLYRNTVDGVAQKLPSYMKQIAILPAAAYDALQARVAELEKELEGDQRHYGDVIERAHERIATLEAELAAKTAECERITKQCDTCNGTGVMECLKEVLPPDEREVYEHAECGECHGTGVGWIGQIIAERDTARTALPAALAALREMQAALEAKEKECEQIAEQLKKSRMKCSTQKEQLQIQFQAGLKVQMELASAKEEMARLAAPRIQECIDTNRVQIADSTISDYLAPEIESLLPRLGVKDALITDKSHVCDFPVRGKDALPSKYVWQVAVDNMRTALVEAERLRGELEDAKKHNEFILSHWPDDTPAPQTMTIANKMRPGVGVDYARTHVEALQKGMEASEKSSRLVGQSEPRF